MLPHAAYLQSFKSQIEASYRKALAEGAVEPAVLLLDTEAESARAFAETSGQHEEIAAFIAECRRCGGSLTLRWGTPRTLAVTLLDEIFPEVAKVMSVPNDDEAYWVAWLPRVRRRRFSFPALRRPVDEPSR
jgi:hypothetical protein